MQLIKRDLILCIAFTAFVVVCALAWGSPFIRNTTASSNNAGANAILTQAQTQQAPAQSTLFRGKVLRNGEQFLLRDGSGQVFRLDDPEQAQSFEGKDVTITGKLDLDSRMIHVDRIESAMV
jgi:uncharacterized protein YdeI (BOF family)